VGAVYAGKVVNITKFGAFVNVLPGRDGLLHISKLSSLAGGKRINNVEDVLTLGQAVEVRVDDIDPQGKVSLSLAGEPERAPQSAAGGSANGDAATSSSSSSSSSSSHSPAKAGGVSFEDAFEAELVADLGDLGPGAAEGGKTAATAGTAGTAGPRAGVRAVVDRDVRSAVRHSSGHRDHGGCPLGRGCLLGRHRLT
jgi:polyribonucleotide nucleotidyltransferase